MEAPGGSPQTAPPGTPTAPPGLFADIPTTPPTPQEQVWMARTLDALDQALHAGEGANAPKVDQGNAQSPAQGQAQSEQAGQNQDAAAQAMAQAQAAMAAAAQAAAQAMRSERSESSEDPAGMVGKSEMMVKSKGGVKADGTAQAYGQTAELKGAIKPGEWGKLPKQVAEELSQGQRENIAGEYRNQIETYYRVIAEKSKK